MQPSEDGRWRFYVISPLVGTEGLTKAYRHLHPVVREMPQPCWIDPLEIKLIDRDNPIAKDVLAVHQRTPGPRVCPIRWGGRWVGDMSVEGAYLYLLPAGASS